MPLISEVASVLEELAPLELAEAGDKVGLIVGRTEQEVITALVALDLTEEVIAEAEEVKAGLIITHHPPFRRVVADLCWDSPAGRLLGQLIKKESSVYTM